MWRSSRIFNTISRLLSPPSLPHYLFGNNSIVDVSDPTTPTRLGTYDSPDTVLGASDVFVVNETAYLVADDLYILDVSTPGNITQIGSFVTPGGATDVQMAGNLAYIADGSSGLLIVDVTDSTSPTGVGSADTPGDALGIFVIDTIAYIADDDSGVSIINVANPMVPVVAGSYNTPGNAKDVVVANNIAYVADYKWGLRIVDVVIPSESVEIASYNPIQFVSKVFVLGDRAYVIENSRALSIIDIAVPLKPVKLGFYEVSRIADNLFVVGDMVYLALSDSLRIIDVSIPTNPTERGVFPIPGFGEDVFVTGSTAYIVDRDGQLTIVDVSDPDDPVQLGIYETPGFSAYQVFVSNGIAYVTYYASEQMNGVRFWDVSDPAHAVELGFYDDEFVSNVFVVDNIAYVDHVTAVDVSDPSSPLKLGRYDPLYGPDASFVAGTTAYILSSNAPYYINRRYRLEVTDFSDPENPTRLDYMSFYGLDLFVVGDMLFVAAGSDGLEILRYTGPADARPMITFDTPTFSADETEESATIQLRLTTTATNPISVEYSVDAGTATADSDYQATGGILTFEAGDTVKAFTVASILDDSVDEPDETLSLTLHNATNAILGLPTTTKLIINDDDDSPDVGFAREDYSLIENTGQISIPVTLAAASERLITIDYTTSDATAVGNEDYRTTSGTLTYTPGETVNEIVMSIQDDQIDEGDEQFFVNLSDAINASLISSQALVTITDNDTAAIAVTKAANVSAAHIGDEIIYTYVITNVGNVTLANLVVMDDRLGEVTLNAAELEAGSVAHGTLSHRVGEADLPSPLVNTAVVTGTSTGGRLLHAQMAETVKIVNDDDDLSAVGFAREDYSLIENAGQVLVPVTLAAASAKLITVDYTTSDATAVENEDYRPISGTLTYTPGETVNEIVVSILDDQLDEPDETLNLTLHNATNAILGLLTTTKLIINDDDDPPDVGQTKAIYLPLVQR